MKSLLEKIYEMIYILEKSSKNECEEIFGKYLFGEYKNFYKTVKEKDTKEESEIFNLVLSWVEKARGRQALEKHLSKLMKCKEQYPIILSQSQLNFYRAVTLPESNEYVKDIREFEVKVTLELRKLRETGNKLKYEEFWNQDKTRKEFLKYTNIKIKYKPQFKLESWSTSKSSVIKFAERSKHVITTPFLRGNGMSLIIRAELPRNEVIFNPKFMNKLAVDKGWWPQNEVIRLSKNKSPIDVVAFQVSIAPQIHYVYKYEIPKKPKKEIMALINTEWKKL